MIRVLLVCTGNVCRSPMAEGILRKLLRDRGIQAEIVAESAGTAALDGAPPSLHSVEVAMEEGIDLRGHAARPLSRRLVGRAALILAMEPEHRDWIVREYPDASQKTHLITLYGDPEGDPAGVPDPIGLDPGAYHETYARIDTSLRAAMPRILSLLPEGMEPTTNRRT